MASHPTTLHYSAPDFSPSQLGSFSLNLKIAAWEVIAVIINDQNTVVGVLQFSLDANQPWQEQVMTLFTTNNILGHKQWQRITVITCSQHFALIPNQIFNADLLDEYQRLLFQPVAGEKLAYHSHKNGYVNVFGLDAALENWITNLYNTQVTFLHQTSGLIESLMYGTISNAMEMSIWIEPTYMIVLVKNGNSLRFCNLYSTKADTDIAYFTLLVMKELGMKPETDIVKVYGNTHTESPAYQTLYRYIRNISLGHKPSFLEFGSDFDQVIPAYRHSDIYGVPLCNN